MIKTKLSQYCFCIKKIFLILIITLLSGVFALFPVIILSGCESAGIQSTTTKQDISAQDSNNEGSNNNQESATSETAAETSSIQTSASEPKGEELTITSIDINVYYVDGQAEYLIGEKRTIEGTVKEDFIINAFNELLKPPSNSSIYNIMPFGTKILGAIYIEDNAILDLSREFVDNKGQDGLMDLLIINCIAATITEIPGVNAVIINVEGKKLNTYGSMDIKNPIERDSKLIKN
ncbi:MAG: GerMN domain-containing protein [Cyanobacteria bacterium]|nr:GerMN domain-containing protein [Cyanobacteriota bacterium]